MRTALAIFAAFCLTVAAVAASLRADAPGPTVPAAPDGPVRIGERYSFGSDDENFAFMHGYGRFEVLDVRGQWAFVRLWERDHENAGRKQWINLAQAKVIVPLGPKKGK